MAQPNRPSVKAWIIFGAVVTLSVVTLSVPLWIFLQSVAPEVSYAADVLAAAPDAALMFVLAALGAHAVYLLFFKED